MRTNRLLAGLAVVVMTATPLTLVASADASQHRSGVVQNVAEKSAEKAKSRTITMDFGADGATFRLTGKVSPQGSKKAVTLLRATSLHGTYHVVANDKANVDGRFAFTGLAKEGFFQARVTESSGYRTSFSKVVHVCKGGC